MSSPHHNNHSPNEAADSFGGLLDPWPFLQDTSVDLLGLEYGLLEQEHVPLMDDLSILQVQGSAQQDGRDHDPTSMAEAEEPRTSTGCKTKRKNQKLKGLSALEEDEVELDRNAKERARRIKLHASYLGLGALLPDSRRSKKWSAPIIVDKVVEYIPELEKEIKKLTLKKENMLAVVENNEISGAHDDDEAPTVTVHPVNKREMIVQICMNRRRDRDREGSSLSSIVHKVEEQGMCIVDASTVSLCDGGVCTFHLHIQMDERSDGGEYNAEVVREKVISWLAT